MIVFRKICLLSKGWLFFISYNKFVNGIDIGDSL